LGGGFLAWTLPGAVRAFLAGVRRGLRFRTPGGEDAGQILTMPGFFLLALGGLVSPWPAVSLVLLIVGYAGVVLLDRIAASRREAPPFFARPRAAQMVIPVSLLCSVGFLSAEPGCEFWPGPGQYLRIRATIRP
jgi:branched-subunit amino acid ABC-type transport system permease component